MTEEEITPLSEDDEQQHTTTMGPQSLVQHQQQGQLRVNWIIRHSGSKHLARLLFQRVDDIVPFADIIVSLKDDIGTTYTSYVHLDTIYRATTLHHVLQRAECVAFFRIYDVTKSMMHNSRHFKKIAQGVKSVHENLIIELADPSIHFGIFIDLFIK